jgi:pantetheine-phosphate adenylyltransferase
MSNPTIQRAVFPGMFDPFTNGHLDVVTRGADLFSELIVAVGNNPAKSPLLAQQKRADIIREITDDLPNVRVETYTGLTADVVRSLDSAVILRGIRNGLDLNDELQMAQMNRTSAGVETVFILTSPACAFISSSLVRQIAQGGGDVSQMVPPQVLKHLQST